MVGGHTLVSRLMSHVKKRPTTTPPSRRRNGGASRPRRAAHPTGTTRRQRVAEAVFALDFAFVSVRAEHVERVVARGLLDDVDIRRETRKEL